MSSRFFQRFRRITYSTSYLPEIDGLRFLAISQVVLFLHITHYLDQVFFSKQITLRGGYWANFVYEGGTGVPLFFVISGFILTIPFARWMIRNEKKVNLKNYFIRRVFRLEPPYIIALSILFVGHVWVLQQYSFEKLLPHFFASVFYLHGAIYHSFSTIMPVAWSLEVEVQFYILAPLFATIFLIHQRKLRWLISTIIILSSAVIWFNVWTLGHVFMYLHYFFSGILLADLYCCDVMLFKKERAGLVAGIVALLGFLFIPSLNFMLGYLLKLVCMFVLVHSVLTNPGMKKIFSVTWIILIGGMCYSIYLLHFAVVSAVGHLMKYSGMDFSNPVLFVPLAILMAVIVLIVSAVFFLFVEKPFMKPLGLKKESKTQAL